MHFQASDRRFIELELTHVWLKQRYRKQRLAQVQITRVDALATMQALRASCNFPSNFCTQSLQKRIKKIRELLFDNMKRHAQNKENFVALLLNF